MVHVWIDSFRAEGAPKPVYGGWYCPEMNTYGITRQVASENAIDDYRMGLALAVLSAYNRLGDNLILHARERPHPRWVINPQHSPPKPWHFYRFLYCMEIYPRMRRFTILVRLEESHPNFTLLSHIQRKEMLPECT